MAWEPWNFEPLWLKNERKRRALYEAQQAAQPYLRSGKPADLEVANQIVGQTTAKANPAKPTADSVIQQMFNRNARTILDTMRAGKPLPTVAPRSVTPKPTGPVQVTPVQPDQGDPRLAAFDSIKTRENAPFGADIRPDVSASRALGQIAQVSAEAAPSAFVSEYAKPLTDKLPAGDLINGAVAGIAPWLVGLGPLDAAMRAGQAYRTGGPLGLTTEAVNAGINQFGIPGTGPLASRLAKLTGEQVGKVLATAGLNAATAAGTTAALDYANTGKVDTRNLLTQTFIAGGIPVAHGIIGGLRPATRQIIDAAAQGHFVPKVPRPFGNRIIEDQAAGDALVHQIELDTGVSTAPLSAAEQRAMARLVLPNTAYQPSFAEAIPAESKITGTPIRWTNRGQVPGVGETGYAEYFGAGSHGFEKPAIYVNDAILSRPPSSARDFLIRARVLPHEEAHAIWNEVLTPIQQERVGKMLYTGEKGAAGAVRNDLQTRWGQQKFDAPQEAFAEAWASRQSGQETPYSRLLGPILDEVQGQLSPEQRGAVNSQRRQMRDWTPKLTAAMDSIATGMNDVVPDASANTPWWWVRTNAGEDAGFITSTSDGRYEVGLRNGDRQTFKTWQEAQQYAAKARNLMMPSEEDPVVRALPIQDLSAPTDPVDEAGRVFQNGVPDPTKPTFLGMQPSEIADILGVPAQNKSLYDRLLHLDEKFRLGSLTAAEARERANASTTLRKYYSDLNDGRSPVWVLPAGSREAWMAGVQKRVDAMRSAGWSDAEIQAAIPDAPLAGMTAPQSSQSNPQGSHTAAEYLGQAQFRRMLQLEKIASNPGIDAETRTAARQQLHVEFGGQDQQPTQATAPASLEDQLSASLAAQEAKGRTMQQGQKENPPTAEGINKMIAAAEAKGGYDHYGIRILENATDDPLAPSRVWEDNNLTSDTLSGPSVIDLGQVSTERALQIAQQYFGDRVVLLGANLRTIGEDVGEGIFRDPVVLGEWNKGTPRTMQQGESNLSKWDQRGDNPVHPDLYPRPVGLGETPRLFGDEGLPQSADVAPTEPTLPGMEPAAPSRFTAGNAWAVAKDVLNAPRATLSSLDASQTLRQNYILGIQHPGEFRQSIVDSVKAWKSAENAAAMQKARQADSDYGVLKDAGWYERLYGEQAQKGPIENRDEKFMSSWVGKIPGLRASERSFSEGVNSLTWAVSKGVLAEMRAAAPNGLVDAAALRRRIELINAMAGRGKIPKELQSGALNATFFSPRFLASRVELAGAMLSRDPAVKRDAAKALAGFIGVNSAILGMAAAAGASGIIPGLSVGLDPAKNLGKVTLGNTSYDFWAGYAPLVRFVYQLATNDAGYGNEQSKLTTLGKFAQGKLAPVPGAVLDVLRGENPTGTGDFEANPSGIGDTIYRAAAPIFLQQVADALKTGDVATALKQTPDFVGIGTNTYTPRTQQLDEQAQALATANPDDYPDGVSGFYDLQPKDRQAIKDQHPDLWKAYMANASGNSAAAETVRTELAAKQESLDQQLLSGNIPADQWMKQYQSLRDELRYRSKQIYSGTNTPNEMKTPLDRYYHMLDGVTDGTLTWDDVDAWMAQQPAADQKYIEQNTGLGGTPLVRAVKQYQNEYYDLPKYRGFSADEGSAIDELAGYARSYATNDAGRLAALNVIAAKNPRAYSPRVVAAARRMLIDPNLGPQEDVRRTRYKKQHPAMAALMGNGFLNPRELTLLKRQIGA